MARDWYSHMHKVLTLSDVKEGEGVILLVSNLHRSPVAYLWTIRCPEVTLGRTMGCDYNLYHMVLDPCMLGLTARF
jgi:hypothetical protein